MTETGQTTKSTSNVTDMNTAGTKTNIVNPALQSGALGNMDYAKSLQSGGYKPYTSNTVAPEGWLQEVARARVSDIAGSDTGAAAQDMISRYASGGPQSVSAGTISSRMSPYMSAYVEQAMKPTMRMMDIQNAASNKRIDDQATSRGAFGDARQGVESANNTFNQDIARQGLIGQAYDRAFSQAIGAGAQDVTNDLNAQNMNANYGEIALNRALGGASAMQGLQNQQLGVQGILNQFGQQRTAQDQAALTAQYNQWLMSQQYPFQTTGLVDQALKTATGALPADQYITGREYGTKQDYTTGTEAKPDNSGYALAGAVLPKLLSSLPFMSI
jgi:hypothetical protein